MAKPEWGTKRMCPSCGARFYDLRRNPVECPKCEFTFEPEAPTRPPQDAAEQPAEAAPKTAKVPDEIRDQAESKDGDDDTDADLVADIDVDDDDDVDDDEAEDKGVLEDASDLVGDDDVPSVRERAAEGGDEDR